MSHYYFSFRRKDECILRCNPNRYNVLTYNARRELLIKHRTTDICAQNNLLTSDLLLSMLLIDFLYTIYYSLQFLRYLINNNISDLTTYCILWAVF